jgi:uncharacterized membrane protein
MNVLSAVDATLRLLNWLVPVVYGSTFLSRSISRVVGATFLILLCISAILTHLDTRRKEKVLLGPGVDQSRWE